MLGLETGRSRDLDELPETTLEILPVDTTPNPSLSRSTAQVLVVDRHISMDSPDTRLVARTSEASIEKSIDSPQPLRGAAEHYMRPVALIPRISLRSRLCAGRQRRMRGGVADDGRPGLIGE